MNYGRRQRERQPDRLFFVSAEGERTEYDYVDFLNSQFGVEYKFRIDVPRRSTRRNGLKPVEVVEEAVKAATTGDFHEVWALFDRDQHTRIPEAIKYAKEGGVEVGFSNPSFELWLLLHFDNVPAGWRASAKDVIDTLRRNPAFCDYGIRGGKRLTGDRAQCLAAGQDAAVRRARVLVDQCPTGSCTSSNGHSEHCPPLHRHPSTDVWRLVVALMTG